MNLIPSDGEISEGGDMGLLESGNLFLSLLSFWAASSFASHVDFGCLGELRSGFSEGMDGERTHKSMNGRTDQFMQKW